MTALADQAAMLRHWVWPAYYEGLTDEGMSVLNGLWARYDGTRRNPFNPIECGDHYIRNAAGWSVLEALTGYHHNALTKTITFAPLPIARSTDAWHFPFTTDTGWATATHSADNLTLTCHAGFLDLSTVLIDGTEHSINARIYPGEPFVIHPRE